MVTAVMDAISIEWSLPSGNLTYWKLPFLVDLPIKNTYSQTTSIPQWISHENWGPFRNPRNMEPRGWYEPCSAGEE